jgi:ABC-2 type transport system permease protein
MSAGALVAAERIKLGSVRSPWWCAGVAVLGVIGLTVLVLLVDPPESGSRLSGGNPFLQFGLVVVLVMAAVSVTTEYRYSTVRATFEAVPSRSAAMLAKAAVVAVAGALIGLVASFGSWAAIWVLAPGGGAVLDSADSWRELAGPAGVFAAGAVLALAVGILVRHTAAAVSILLVWTLLVENLLAAIPGFGEVVVGWLPFVNATNATAASSGELPLGPWGSLAYFAGFAAALFGVALVVVNRRDA